MFWLPNATREQHLHALMRHSGAAGRLTVATAATDHANTATSAGRVWRVVGQQHLRLSDIPTVPTPDTDP